MMVAGEVSGDVHGAGLIRCLGQNNENIDFFGSEIITYNILEQDKYKIIEYKPIYGDCLKNLLNDYIITDKEKKIHNILINKR